MKRWNPPTPDAQMISEAETENTMRDIVEWRIVANGRSKLGLDKDGNVLVRACGLGPSQPAIDPGLASQALMETGSQDLGFDDEWA